MDADIINQIYMILAIIGGLFLLAVVALLLSILWALVTNSLWKRFCDQRDIGHIMEMVRWAERFGPFERSNPTPRMPETDHGERG